MKTVTSIVFFVSLLLFFAGCSEKQFVDLPDNYSESITYRSFLTDTEINNYEYTEEKIEVPPDKRTVTWAHELMVSKARVKDMKFLLYSAFDVGADGKSDNYVICGYSESLERVFYMRVNKGEGYLKEVRKPTDLFVSSIGSVSNMMDASNIVADAASRGGECPEGMIIEINSSKIRAVVGCPGKWRYTDIEYLKFGGGSSFAASEDE